MTAVIVAQGSLLTIKLRTHSRALAHDPGKRGMIASFSKASRLRMMQFMARLRVKNIRATFITLTFSGLPSAAEAKAALKRFTMRIRRKYGNVSGLWRMEFQQRGSVHFHLLLFGLPFIPQARLQLTWEECTQEERSIVDIRLVLSKKAITNYIAKYLAKVDQAAVSTSLEDDAYQHDHPRDAPGRFWGYINKNALPYGERLEGVLIERQAFLYLHWTIRKLSRGRGAPSLSRATLFSEEASEMFAYAMAIGGLYDCENRKAYKLARTHKLSLTLTRRTLFEPTSHPALYRKFVGTSQGRAAPSERVYP